MPDGVVATAPSTARTGTRAAPPGLPTSGAAAVQSVDRAVTVLLAALPADRWEDHLGRPLERFTPATVTGPEALREQLAAARERGYAVAVEELEVGLNAVAAPLRSYDGAVVGAVSASGPSYRFPAGRLPEVAALVVAGAADTSARLGHLRRTGSPTARTPGRG